MDEKAVPLTRDGLRRIEEELSDLVQHRRPEIAERIKTAREFGDISENAEYTEAKNEQSLIEGRIQTLEVMVRNAALIEEEPREKGVVELGAEVVVAFVDGEDGENDGEETYRIVGAAEADPLQGRISTESPLGNALLGHRAGDEVEWDSPSGEAQLRVVRVR